MDRRTERIEIVVVNELVQQRVEQRLRRDRPLLRGGPHEDLDRAVHAAAAVQLVDDTAAAPPVGPRLVAQDHLLASEHELATEQVDELLRTARETADLPLLTKALMAGAIGVHDRRRTLQRTAREGRVEPRAIESAEERFREHAGAPLRGAIVAALSSAPIRMAASSMLLKKLLLALVGAPLLVTLLLALGELAARLLTASHSPAAPHRFFLRELHDGCDVLAATGSPPFAGAHFRADTFPIERPAGTTRIVCLGDSTVHGHPFEEPAPFACWLAARLARLLPDRAFDVVNLGVNGMNAEAVLDLVRELRPLAPDVAIVYVGHNEFLDSNLEASLHPLDHAIERLRLHIWLLARLQHWIPASAAIDPMQRRLSTPELVDDTPLLTDTELARGRANYEVNVRAIVAELRALGTTPVLCLPVCDLVDTPPQRSLFPPGTSAEKRTALRARLAAVATARREFEVVRRSTPTAPLPPLLEQWRADAASLRAEFSTVALVRYEIGRVELFSGEIEAARSDLVAARDCDAHPVRSTAATLATLRHIAEEEHVLLVDPWPAFVAAAPSGIAGQDGLFVDYVHPDLAGHRLLADTLLHAFAENGLFADAASWRFTDEPTVAEYEVTMGLSRRAQADSFARRGLFALGSAFLNPKAKFVLKAASDFFERALALDRDCALGHAGRGALQVLNSATDAALAEFTEADRLDAHALDLIRENYSDNSEVRALFERAGLEVSEGRIIRRRS